uniref:Uncharacterized protein n=1 Tax=Bostrychia tenella TaxID=324755 RepID=A0A1Z1M5B2_9FLOR|nr:hypothetical protein [Bostrychia tenella]ARW61196.1 hypothetical protein [Bostrychia tenella]
MTTIQEKIKFKLARLNRLLEIKCLIYLYISCQII